jgi:two-component system chemotaxis sensor kinase CheA
MTRDPYRYFRVEARELVEGLSRGVLDFEKGVAPADAAVALLRLAHTLKGAARVVRETKIADTAHAIEDILGPYRDGSLARDRALRPEDAQQLLAFLDSISSAVAALDPSHAKTPDSPSPVIGTPAAPVETLRSVRVGIEEMDALLGGLFEASVQLSALRKRMEALSTAVELARGLSALLPHEGRERAAIDEIAAEVSRAERSLASGLDRVENEIGDVQDKAQRLRLVPASTIFGTLERAVRDAAQALKKEARFEAHGGECRVEANVLFALRDALIHVVRNAVAHGIEAPNERTRLRKPVEGKVELRVERRGQRIAFVCKDDGKGIDVDTVARAAASRTAAGPLMTDAMPREQVLRLILESGVSTAESVTAVSGRGVGLDVLRKTALGLQGEIALESEPGRGMTVDVCVPLSVTSIVTLVFEVAGLTLSLPLDAVERTMNIGSESIVRSAQQEAVIVEDRRLVLLPVTELAAALGQPAAGRERQRRGLSAAVVVQSASRSAAIEIDRLVGTSMAVLRPLPPLSGPSPLVSGASLDAEGHPKLILDPRGLVDAAHRTQGASRASEAPVPRPPILVVDDSLTTRMLEQSILESAGYAVELATSAEQAEAKARESTYSLFLVDVEMPGMDGFEFVSRTRADPQTRGIPAILVTSRDAPEDRKRGVEVGASGYVVKGEFDQGYLLGTIRQLIG